MSRKSVERNIAYDDIRDCYYVRYYFGVDENGKAIETSGTFSNLDEARKALTLHEAERYKGTAVFPEKTTLKDWLEYWMNDVINISRAPTTVHGYQNIIENHIVPELGTTPLQKLTASQIQSYYAKMAREKKLSSNTIKKHHDLLNTALKLAEKQDKIQKNPLLKVDAPKQIKKEIKYYSPEQLRTLLALIPNHPIEIVVYLAAYLGLRREEICGLKWSNVDMENKIIQIRAVRTTAGKKIVDKAPKSKASNRDLAFKEDVHAVLTKVKAKQEEACTYLGSAYSNSDFVIAKNDGTPYRPNYLSTLFTDFIKSNNLPHVTLHGLRHSFASAANAGGATLYDISKTLGHSNTAITSQIYTHVLDSNHGQTIQRVADIIKSPTTKI